jgi:hypothetical protein
LGLRFGPTKYKPNIEKAREGEARTFVRLTSRIGRIAKFDHQSRHFKNVPEKHGREMPKRFAVIALDHVEAYQSGESFFSRLRRTEIGTHRHIAGPYLAAYAAEMDWREDHRRESNGEQFAAIVTAAASIPFAANARDIGSAALHDFQDCFGWPMAKNF